MNLPDGRIFHHIRSALVRYLSILLIVASLSSTAEAQTTLKAVYGWGTAARLGRWTPLLATVRVPDPDPIEAILQIEGTYGTGAALCISQPMVVESRPRTYLLLFPLNADPTKLAVTLRRESDNRILATKVLLDPQVFTPAGHIPPTILAANGPLIGIGGNVADALLLQSQLSQTGLTAGILSEMKLPAASVGYESAAALLLAEPDFQELDADQQRAIVDWVAAGGNLVVIPPANSLPQQLPLDILLPCDIGVDQSVPLPPGVAQISPAAGAGGQSGIAIEPTTEPTTGPATVPVEVNGRQLRPCDGAIPIELLNGGRPWTAWSRRWGLGRVVVLPADVSALQFADSDQTIAFWRKIFAGMLEVPGHKTITENPVSDSEEDIMPVGPKMADAIGRGPRETLAIRHLLDFLDASTLQPGASWKTFFLWLAGIGALLGPFDWIVSVRAGASPRHWATILGFVAMLTGATGYGVTSLQSPELEVSSIRLIDQADGKTVATTDLLAVRSTHGQTLPVQLDPAEWWEPANQSAANFSANRFLEFDCQEDQSGCRPVQLKLRAGDPQSLRGQTMSTSPPVFDVSLKLQDGSAVGTLTNLSNSTIENIQIAGAAGVGEIDGSLAPGATIVVNCPLKGSAINLEGLSPDALDITPDRTDRISALIADGSVLCVYGQLPEAPAPHTIDAAATYTHREIIRAVAAPD